MPNITVTLMIRCQTPKGWRRYPAAFGKNGRVRPLYAMIDGKAVECPHGHYVLRFYRGAKVQYENAGDNAATGYTLKLAKEKLLTAKTAARDAGIVLPEVPGRKYLRREANRYIQDRKDAGAMEAAQKSENVLEEFILTSGRTFVDEITRQDIFDYHAYLRKQWRTDRTIAEKHTRLRSFLKFAGVDVKTVMPEKPKYEKALPTVYSAEEIESLLSTADPYMRLAIELGYKTGLREQEMEFLEWSDIDWPGRVLRVQGKPHWGFKVKDSEQRDVPIPNDLLALLKERKAAYPKTRLVLGTGEKANKPNGHLLRLLKALAQRAGLACGLCDGCTAHRECSQFTLHKLRRSYATTLLRSGVDIRTVQAFMGHADLTSTLRYLRPAGSRETQAAINSIFSKSNKSTSKAKGTGKHS
jgi:integrase